jgi:hypothetical protein
MTDSEYPMVRVVLKRESESGFDLRAVKLQTWLTLQLPWLEEPEVTTEGDNIVISGRFKTLEELTGFWMSDEET